MAKTGHRIELNDEQQPAAEVPAAEEAVQAAGGRREVQKHRQCPLCYDGDKNGVGVAYSSPGNKRYYKCDRCSHTWVATVKTTVDRIEHREVELNER